MEDLLLVNKKRTREDETESELSKVKRLKKNLLDGLEDDAEFCSTSQDLDSFMKSFKDEITNSPSSAAEVVDLTASAPDLGYLLEASDDELGLPPTASGELRKELERVDSGCYELGGEFWEAPSFEFGVGETDNYAPLDGLFDYSDVGYGSGSDFLWMSESMPAQ